MPVPAGPLFPGDWLPDVLVLPALSVAELSAPGAPTCVPGKPATAGGTSFRLGSSRRSGNASPPPGSSPNPASVLPPPASSELPSAEAVWSPLLSAVSSGGPTVLSLLAPEEPDSLLASLSADGSPLDGELGEDCPAVLGELLPALPEELLELLEGGGWLLGGVDSLGGLLAEGQPLKIRHRQAALPRPLICRSPVLLNAECFDKVRCL